MNRQLWLLLLLLLALSLPCTRCHDHPSPAPLPNVLLFMADDLGYGDLGCYGNRTLRTPNLDRLAKDGVTMTQSLAAASLCTPSRAAFLTGRYPIRDGMAPSSFLRVSFLTASATGLPASQLTLAKVAKQAGHTTALLGKWHLGWSVDRSDPDHIHPLNHGFDYFYGLPLTLIKDFDPRETKAWRLSRPHAVWQMSLTSLTCVLCTCMLLRMGRLGRMGSVVVVGVMGVILASCGVCYWMVDHLALLNSFMFRNYQIVEQPIQPLSQVTRKLVREGVEFLENRHQDGQPFLLMVSWLHVHTPLDTGPAFRGRSSHGPYGDAVEEMDWGIGELVNALEKLGLGENTLVYFTSDNGGHIEESDFAGRRTGGYNGGLKGGKAQGAPEGGIRVPTILKWPAGKIPAGVTTDEPVSLMDVLPTVASALRVPLPAGHVMDGHDLLPLLRGEVGVSSHQFLFHYCQREVHAVRYRPRQGTRTWKLVLYEPDYVGNTHHCPHYFCRCSDAIPLHPPRLYDLTSDPGEQRPLLADDMPEYGSLVEGMLAALESHRRSLEPAEDMFSVGKMLWRPWDQPVCRFPEFRCRDVKFDGVFEDEEGG